MKLTISKEVTFIPEFNGNKDLPSTEQIVVQYKNPTTAIKNSCKPRSTATAISDRSGAVDHMEISIETDDILVLKQMLISISGCSYEDDKGNETVIRTAKDLIEAPVQFEPLLHEIVAEFNKALNAEVNEKNSE